MLIVQDAGKTFSLKRFWIESFSSIFIDWKSKIDA